LLPPHCAPLSRFYEDVAGASSQISRLVYRVFALPETLMLYVWDMGCPSRAARDVPTGGTLTDEVTIIGSLVQKVSRGRRCPSSTPSSIVVGARKKNNDGNHRPDKSDGIACG